MRGENELLILLAISFLCKKTLANPTSWKSYALHFSITTAHSDSFLIGSAG